MILDGISASQHLDSSGEVLQIKGHEISDLDEGRGVLNWEHNNDSSEDIIGAIIYAKKIMKKSDCANDRERLYWDACGTPFIYIKAELFDNEEHPGAIAAAAMIRYYHRKGEKILAGFSIEGSTLERNDNVLERTVGRRVALTLRPCNKSAIAGVLEDDKDDEVKKFMNLSSNSNIKTVEVDTFIFDDIEKKERTDGDYFTELKTAIKELQKTLTAGSYDAAPSQLTGGSALQVEHRPFKRVGLSRQAKEKLKRAVESWDKKRPLKETIKAVMPEVSEEYLDHFTELAEELSLKKGIRPSLRIDPHHSWNINMNEKQRGLIRGLYMDTAKPYHGDEHNDPRNEIQQLKNDNGDRVLIKHPTEYIGDHDPAVSSAAFYKIANDYFGMGDHVPVTNHFRHSSVNAEGRDLQAMQFVEGAHTPYDAEWKNTMKTSRESGSGHKLALMSMIMDSDNDRHYGNMLGKNGKIVLIDNDDSFRYNGSTSAYPTYYHDFQDADGEVEQGIGKDIMHIDAVKWLSELDPRALVKHILRAGINKEKIPEAVARLHRLQASSGQTIYKMHDLIYPKPRRPRKF